MHIFSYEPQTLHRHKILTDVHEAKSLEIGFKSTLRNALNPVHFKFFILI